MNHLLNRGCQIHLIVLIAFISLIFFSCAPTSDWSKLIDWKDLTFSDLPGEKEYPDAGAIVILDEGTMEISGTRELPMSVFERHRIIKILNTRGQRYANVAIPYPTQSQVEHIQARTISPDGIITVMDEKNIYDINLYPNFIFYSDQRAKLFTMPAVENGSVIEYRYQIHIGNYSLWPSWSFQDNEPTLKSRFTLVTPSEWELKYKLYQLAVEPVVTKAPPGFKSTYSWEVTKISALKSELGMPSLNDCLARLELSPVGITTWDDVSQWYFKLAEPQMNAGRNVKTLATTLTQGIESEAEKLKIIYDWVRDHIRYIAVAIGIGSFQPHPAEEILLNRYGDCKDMSTLLCSLAREIGIDACQVLVSTWQNGKPDTSLPSPYQFNHAIAYCPSVGDNGIWMDATEKGCPFGKLPWYDQDLAVLVVNSMGAAEIKITPRAPVDSNYTRFNWQVDLKPSGAATVQGETNFSGAFGTEMREALYFSAADLQKQWLETYLAKRCSGTNLSSFHISGLQPVCDPLTLSYIFTTATFAPPRAEELIFRPGQIVAIDLPDYFRAHERIQPIQFRFGSHLELNLSVHLPENWVVVKPVPSDSIVSPFGKASWSYFSKDHILMIHADYRFNGDAIDTKQYLEFRTFLDEMRNHDLYEVVLKKKNIEL